jgi:hypothetical protein
MLPCHSEVSLAVAILCQVQLFKLLGSSASMLTGHHSHPDNIKVPGLAIRPDVPTKDKGLLGPEQVH